MSQNNEPPKAFIRHGRSQMSVQPVPERRGHNFPAPLEAFDRERMGVAAKE